MDNKTPNPDCKDKNAIRIVFGELQRTLNGFIEKQEAIYGKDPYHDTLGDRFIYLLAQAHQKTGLRAVVLIDEKITFFFDGDSLRLVCSGILYRLFFI